MELYGRRALGSLIHVELVRPEILQVVPKLIVLAADLFDIFIELLKIPLQLFLGLFQGKTEV